ncbi:MAG: S9 family peptidase, partial [Microbacterium sp.]
ARARRRSHERRAPGACLPRRRERLAFLRGDAAGKPQVHVVRATGGEPVQATDAAAGVGSFAWSPDGNRIAYVSRVVEPGRYGSVEGLEADAESPRRVTGIRWHANGLGYLADRPAHLFLIDAPDADAEPFYEPAPTVRADGDDAPTKRVVAGEATQLTHGAASYSGIAFTPDGAEILTVPDEIEADRRDLRSSIVAVRVDGGGSRVVLETDANLSVGDIHVAADGTIAFLAADMGESGIDFIAPDQSLWVLGDDGPRRLTGAGIDLGEVGSHITSAGDDFLVQNRTRGRVELLRVTRDGQSSVVLGGDVEVVGHAASEEGARIVAAYATPDSFGELALVGDGSLTEFGSQLERSGVVLPTEHEITGRDGYPVHGWVAAPAGEGPFPVILQIHGGPYASYGVHVFDETQVLVDAGYAVVYCNPRGSAGYGLEHGKSIRHRMGTVDHHDVIDFFEAVVAADPRLDGAHAGIMGGSYGGYLTAWIIAHDHRFAGAIVERGFLDPVSFQGTSDIGSFFGDEYVGTEPDAIARQSPMAVVSNVTTPTLVIHSELDFRCPLEQATRYYTALKRQGVEAEMLIFPGEDHELTRSGRPRHRVERFAAVLEWWQRVLPTP